MTTKRANRGLRSQRIRLHLTARAAMLAALGLAFLPLCDFLISPGSVISLAHARDDDDDRDERMHKEASEQFKQAEERRREADESQREAARMLEQANERRRQAEEMQSAAANRAQQPEQSRQTPAREAPARVIETRQNSKSDDNRNSNNSQASKNSAQSEKSDKSDKSDKSKSEKDNDKTEKSKKADDLPEGPPATVEQWLKQAFSPKPDKQDRTNEDRDDERADRNISDTRDRKPSVETPAAAQNGTIKTDGLKKADAPKTADSKPADGKTTDSKTANGKPPNSKTGPGGGIAPIELPTERLPEVLAVNASRQTLEKAKGLGFKATAPTSLSNLDLAVTRLLPPDGMNAFEAQALLKRAMPSASFAPNQVYRIYKTASSTRTLPAGTRAATLTPGNMACSDDRCFGRDIIGWKPELRSCVTGVKIGVIDTSIDTTHPAFAKKSLELKHFGKEGARGPDWHGTGITALLAGDAASGTPGLIPDASFYVADIFHAGADDEPASDTVSMLRAFDWLEAKGVKVINMSLSGPPDDLIRSAVQKLAAKGVLLVAAAGNEGPSAGPSYPAAYDQVIAVTAVNKDLQNYRYANRGNYIDVAAPGVSIWTALPGAQGGYHSGTSFATPYVTAALAAIYPRLTSKTQSEALKLISYKDLGAPGPDPVYGHGLLVAPVTCGTGLIAADGPGSAPGSSGGKSGLMNSPPAEVLPWLGFQSSGN